MWLLAMCQNWEYCRDMGLVAPRPAQSACHGIMGRRLLRYRKWVPQQLGDVIKQGSGDSRPMGARHGGTAANHTDLLYLTSRRGRKNYIRCPDERIGSYLPPEFPLFHAAGPDWDNINITLNLYYMSRHQGPLSLGPGSSAWLVIILIHFRGIATWTQKRWNICL